MSATTLGLEDALPAPIGHPRIEPPRPPETRFIVVDLGTQLGGDVRRFTVWDTETSRFWCLSNRQTWTSIKELTDDFAIFGPHGRQFGEVTRQQRDVIVEKALALGFPLLPPEA